MATKSPNVSFQQSSHDDSKTSRQYSLLSPNEIKAMIAEGKHIIIIDQYVLKVDPWLKYHPGGDKAIQHMVGRDATDEVNALHSPAALAQMMRYRIGRIDYRWTNLVPPIQGGIYDAGSTTILSSSHYNPPSSPSLSRTASPVFDSPLASPVDQGLRQRKHSFSAAEPVTRSGSVTSVNSVDDDLVLDPGMAYLDSQTREKIDLDLAIYPSLDPETQDHIVQKYRKLHDRIVAEGLFNCNYARYGREVARYILLFALMIVFLRRGWYALSGLCLGVFWHQLVFSAHDAGHMGITHNFHIDSCIGIFIADFMGGLSLGWWKRNHNVHHIVTNSPEHDPDIEHMPFFAVSHRLLASLRSSYYDRILEYDAAAKFLLRFQAWSYYPILLFGRFNLYRLSWEYLFLGLGPKQGPAWWHRWLEIAGQVFFWYWFGYLTVYRAIPDNWSRFVFVMVSHMVTMPLHVQITLSHFAMSSAELGPAESFPQKMLRTTMDVDCPRWLDFFHGGLQFQAVHHLYPRIPRHNLRRTQKLVQEFCDEVNIPYALFGFYDGNKEVIGKLAEVSRQAAILRQCQKVVAKGHVGHGH